MNDYRKIQRTSEPQLSREDFALHVPWRVIVMIIQPNLAPRNHSPALPGKIKKSLFRAIIKQLRIVRMDADGCKDIRVFFSQLDRAFECAAVRLTGADIEHCRHARVSGTTNHLFAV